MRRTLTVLAVSMLAVGGAAAQPSAPAVDWSAWAPLVGEWEGEAAGGATGGFTFAPELQGRVLVRHNHAEYPKMGERPAMRHDDVMVVYREGDATRADYWDNEGHVIRYVATVEKGKGFTFVSAPAAGQPRYRLTYTVTDAKTVALRFEVAPPNAPDAWKTYIQTAVHRVR